MWETRSIILTEGLYWPILYVICKSIVINKINFNIKQQKLRLIYDIANGYGRHCPSFFVAFGLLAYIFACINNFIYFNFFFFALFWNVKFANKFPQLPDVFEPNLRRQNMFFKAIHLLKFVCWLQKKKKISVGFNLLQLFVSCSLFHKIQLQVQHNCTQTQMSRQFVSECLSECVKSGFKHVRLEKKQQKKI